MNVDINYLGRFGNIGDVWARHPEGGREGDYLDINGDRYRWNKYDELWEQRDKVNVNVARKTEVFGGDVHVMNDLVVGGTLRAHRVKQPNCGLYPSLESLKAAYPVPDVGMWACIGNTIPAPVWRCDVAGEWTATGQTGGTGVEDFFPITLAELHPVLVG